MDGNQPKRSRPRCPLCGGTIERWPAVENSGFVAQCTNCGQKNPVPTNTPLPASPNDKNENSSSRLREILKHSEGREDQEPLPDDLLEDLPEETRQLLQPKEETAKKNDPSGLREELAQDLRRQGYIIDEDSHGVRIGGGVAGRGSSAGMSPYDVIRLASDLEGGLPLSSSTETMPRV